MKHLLKLLDLTTEEIEEILNLADQLKYELKHGIEHHHLKGKTLGYDFCQSIYQNPCFFLKQVCINWVDILCTYLQMICKLDVENQLKIPQECYPAIWTEL